MHRTAKSALAIVVTVGIGIPLWRFGIAISDAPPPAPPRELGPVPVSLHEVAGETLELEITVHGNLIAHERAVVSAELTARIEGVHPGWRPGGEFAEGETLVRLDEATFRFDAEAAAASLEEAAAGVRTAEVEETRAARGWELAVKQRDLARREHERIVALGESGTATASDVDRALAARLDRDLAEENARIGGDAAAAARVAAIARHAAAKTAHARAADRRERTRVLAPFAGRFVGRAPAVGSLAAAGAPLGEIVDVSRLYLSARVPERDLPRLRRGMTARVSFPSTPETSDHSPCSGVVSAIDAVSDIATRRGTVEIELSPLPTPSGATAVPLPVGLFAEARIEIETLPAAIRIERRHLVWEEGAAWAYVLVTRDDVRVAEARRLRLDLEAGEGFTVGAGLAAGDRLITAPLDRVRDGVPCVPRVAEAAK